MTFSVWLKRGALGAIQSIFNARTVASPYSLFHFYANDTLVYEDSNGTFLQTTQVFRDPSAWYHLVLSIDTTQATAANRAKIYVNGSQVTALSTATYPAQNTLCNYNTATAHAISSLQPFNALEYLDGYLAEINFIDGQAITPSSFGSTDPTSGQWVAAKYTGTYGTNGFYLPFSNGTSTTTLGADSSGNGNNWTLTNFTRSAGANDCWMIDVPSGNGGASGTQPNSNYSVLNPLSAISVKPINGNLTFTGASGAVNDSTIGIPTSGKYYAEMTFTTVPVSGNDQAFGLNPIGSTGTGPARAYSSNGQYYNGSAWVSFGGAWAQNDVFGIAVDADNNQLSFYKNNVQQGTTQSYTVAGSSIIFRQHPTTSGTYQLNFGQRSFAYTPPSGFKALCTANLPVATIKQGNKYMDATLYTGTGATLSVTNAGSFKPDFVWVKSRSNAYTNALYDSIRGAGKLLQSQTTNAESGNAGDLLGAFNSNGFSVNTTYSGGSDNSTDGNGSTYVGWQWQAGQGSTSSNTSGSITSTVSVNATAGFSIVTWTGAVGGGTIGHGLGVAPKMIITKCRTTNTSFDWLTYHASLGNTNYIYLNLTNATGASVVAWNNTSPTSSVFSTGTYYNTGNWVAYCFAEISGFSKAFSYTGNGSADGSFIYTGFLPRFVMLKRTDTTGDWYMWDTARNTYDVITNTLLANSSAAETSATSIDALSNGFKLRNTTAGFNASGGTYIGFAWATNPFQNSNAF